MWRVERALLIAAVTMAGCATNLMPEDWLPDPRVAQLSTEGGWVTVTCSDGTRCVDGELIAVAPDGLEVLTRNGFVQVPKSNIDEARLAAYEPEHSNLLIWTITGAISALSHGYYAAISIPMWLVTGLRATRLERLASLRQYPAVPLDDFRPFARFPQGRPREVDPKSLGVLRLSASGTRQPAGALAPSAETWINPRYKAGQTVKVRDGAVLRIQPRRAASGEPPGTAAAAVLRMAVRNADGEWWYVAIGGKTGWLHEDDLVGSP